MCTYGKTISSALPFAASAVNRTSFSRLFSRSKDTGAACTAATLTVLLVDMVGRLRRTS